MWRRGPDDNGIFTDENVALGMSRLAIFDLTTKAHQPMQSNDGNIVLVYNGESFNFRSLRAMLEQRGHAFNSDSDSEVVLRLYEEYSDSFVEYLRGMFSIAIYDKRNNTPRLVLARDIFGIKPLLYSEKDNGILFASEMKAIMAMGLVEKNIDYGALKLLLANGSITQPLTILKDVFMLPPGHMLICSQGKIKIKEWGKLKPSMKDELSVLPYSEQVSMLRDILDESIDMHSKGDVPIGAFLSGGVDSSLIVASMKNLSRKEIETFSVGFGCDDFAADESFMAKKNAEYIGVKNTRVEITGEKIRLLFSDFVYSLDQPSVDGINSFLVSMAAREKVTVALSGTGGDELFGGYPWFWHLQSKSDDFLTSFRKSYQIFGVENAENIISSKLRQESIATKWFANDFLANESIFCRISGLLLKGYTQNQLLRDIDAVSMYSSLEVRVPFLDIKVAEFALSLKDGLKSKPYNEKLNWYESSYFENGSKRILIDAYKDILPKDIDKQSKKGFSMPFEKWMKSDLDHIVKDALSEDSIKRRGLFEYDEVKRLLLLFNEGKESWAKIWLLVVIEFWCRLYIDDN